MVDLADLSAGERYVGPRSRRLYAQTTPFAFDNQQCISGLLHCVTYTPAGHGTRITWYADRVDCQTL